MKCKYCDKTIPENSKYCEHCGKETSKEIIKDDIYNKVVNHLEFVGYINKNETNENKWTVGLFTHPKRSNIMIRYHQDVGFSFSARYIIDKNAFNEKRMELLEIVNKQNSKSALTCFSILEDQAIACYGWYPPEYSKITFAIFIEQYESDISLLLGNESMKQFY